MPLQNGVLLSLPPMQLLVRLSAYACTPNQQHNQQERGGDRICWQPSKKKEQNTVLSHNGSYLIPLLVGTKPTPLYTSSVWKWQVLVLFGLPLPGRACWCRAACTLGCWLLPLGGPHRAGPGGAHQAAPTALEATGRHTNTARNIPQRQGKTSSTSVDAGVVSLLNLAVTAFVWGAAKMVVCMMQEQAETPFSDACMHTRGGGGAK